MARWAPSEEKCIEAAELYAMGYSYRSVAERMPHADGKPISHETARSWVKRGNEVIRVKELIDPDESRWRMAVALDEWMTELLEAKRAGLISLEDSLTHAKWLIRERARFGGTDAPLQSRVVVKDDREPPTVDGDTIEATAAREAVAVTKARERQLLAGSDDHDSAPQY
jgi:hypothetical protein